jgi:hypothetical protein
MGHRLPDLEMEVSNYILTKISEEAYNHLELLVGSQGVGDGINTIPWSFKACLLSLVSV